MKLVCTSGLCVSGLLCIYIVLSFLTWEEVQFLGQKVLESRVNDCWQSWPPLRDRKRSLEFSVTLSGPLPVISVNQHTKSTHQHCCCFLFLLLFLLLLQRGIDWCAHPSLKKCSSPSITVMVSNLSNLQASLVGSGLAVVVVVGLVGSVESVGPGLGAVVGVLGWGGVGSGPVLRPDKKKRTVMVERNWNCKILIVVVVVSSLLWPYHTDTECLQYHLCAGRSPPRSCTWGTWGHL